jgi:hypothetical protein
VKYINESNDTSEIKLSKVATDFYKGSKRMASSFKKDGGYWDSNTEMSARAFACYVMDRLPYRSDYLVGHAESAVDVTADKDGNPEIVFAYPKGEERAAINAAFDEIVADLKKERRLTHEDKAPSVLGRLKEAQTRDFGPNTVDPPAKTKTANQEL